MAKRYCLMKIARTYRATVAKSLQTIFAVTSIYLEGERTMVNYKSRKGEEVKYKNIMTQARNAETAKDLPVGRTHNGQSKAQIWLKRV